MGRLTKRNAWGEVCVSGKSEWDIRNKFMAIANRLAELEDKLENGTLIEQPCKVGDTVWLVKYFATNPPIEIFDEWIIDKIVTTKHGTVFYGTHEGTEDFRPFGDDEYKVNWFTDIAEAQAKLKELKEQAQ